VLIAWENEANLILKEYNKDAPQIVYPSISILAEPPVSVVDKVVEKHRSRAVATAYLQYLYSPEGQAIAAKHFFRPHDAKLAKQFPPIKRFQFEKVFGDWKTVHNTHFAQGAIFDQIMRRR